MARIPYVERNQVASDAQAEFDALASYGPFGHLAGALGHRGPILRNVARMLGELREEGLLKRRYLELALVVVSQLNSCEYCVAHHGPMLTVEGISSEGIASLLDAQNHPGLDEVDRLVVEFARQVTLEPNRMRDAIFDRLREHFSNAEIVELTWRIARCGAFNRFNDVLQLEIEEEAHAVASAA
jgi:uncharacterized peroxidase-related enzyme